MAHYRTGVGRHCAQCSSVRYVRTSDVAEAEKVNKKGAPIQGRGAPLCGRCVLQGKDREKTGARVITNIGKASWLLREA